MDVERLRKRGWSEEELEHLSKVWMHAEGMVHPHARIEQHLLFWILILVMMSGTLAAYMEIVPLLALGNFKISIPITIVLGACFGLLFVHALHDLRMNRAHQHLGTLLLALALLLVVTFILGKLQQRFGGFGSALLLSGAFVAGMISPYLAHWRKWHGSH